MQDYNQTRSFNLGIAKETSIEAALIYDELAYMQSTVGRNGEWFHRSYKQITNRLPFMSENTMRKAINALKDGGWIVTKVKKVDGNPTLHFQIARNLTSKIAETMETSKIAETIYKDARTLQLNNNSITRFSASGDSPKKKSEESKKQLLALVNSITGRQFRVLPSREVKKLLDNFSLDEISQSLSSLVNDPWHKDKLKSLSSNYFLRPTTIDRFLGEKKESPEEYMNRIQQELAEEAENQK